MLRSANPGIESPSTNQLASKLPFVLIEALHPPGLGLGTAVGATTTTVAIGTGINVGSGTEVAVADRTATEVGVNTL